MQPLATTSTLLVVDAPGTPGERIAQSWMRQAGPAIMELNFASRTDPFACCRRGARLGHVHWLDRAALERCSSALTVPQVAMIESISDDHMLRMLNCLTDVDAITTTSKRWQIKLEHLIDREVWRIPHTVDSQKLTPPANRDVARQAAGLQKHEFVLGIVSPSGAGADQKEEVELTFQIATGARESGLEIVFALIGALPEPQLAQARSQNIRLLQHDSIASAAPIMDAFAITSSEDTSPVSILEAMACGIPVLSSNIGHVPDIIVDGQTGFICAERTAKEFLGKINALRNNASLAESIKGAARLLIETERDERVALGKINFVDLYYHAARYYARRPGHEQISRRALQTMLAIRYPFSKRGGLFGAK